MTLYEIYLPNCLDTSSASSTTLPDLPILNVAWIGDANNIVNSMIVTYPKLGLNLNIATPKAYEFDKDIRDYAQLYSQIKFTNDPLEAVKDSDVIVTDTWISMGQESEKESRLENFKGFQVTEDLCRNAKSNWKFLHCLPRKKNEVDDEVFYNPKRSVVFQEAENRKYTVMSVFEYFLKH